MIIYPYQTPDKKNFFPIIPLKIFAGKNYIDAFALIDSGATVSVFREDVAKQLGIRIEEGEKIYLGGVGGRIKGFIHKLKIGVAGKKFSCPIVFSYEYTVSLNLLGREEFFKNFVILFDEKKKRVELK